MFKNMAHEDDEATPEKTRVTTSKLTDSREGIVTTKQ